MEFLNATHEGMDISGILLIYRCCGLNFSLV